MSYKLNPFTGKLDNTGSTSGGVTSIDDLSDVDNSTTPPTDGQALVWDATTGEYKPGTISTSGGGGGTTSWTPDQLTLSMWLDADDATTITETSGAVSQWDDKTSNSFNVVQNTSANQPTLTASGLNGKPVITFDGNDYLDVPASISAQPFTLAVVVKANSTTHAGRNYVFDGAGSSNRVILALDGDPDGTGYAKAYAGSWLGNTAATHDTNAHIAVITYNGSSSTFRWDGGNSVTGNTSTAGLTSGITLGSNYNQSADWFQGAIAEFIILPEVSALNQEKIEGYLAHKWGLESSLPSGHSYKTAAPTVGSGGSTTGLPTPTTDGKALIVENGQWVEGPVIGGVSYSNAAGSYPVTESLLIATDDLTRTPATTSDNQTWTFSLWIKRNANIGVNNTWIFDTNNAGSYTGASFQANNTIVFRHFASGSTRWQLVTNETIADTNWHHCVFSVDTTQATAAERVKIYIDGTEATYASATYPSLNSLTFQNRASYTCFIGGRAGSANRIQSYVADVHMVDGLQLDASGFGENDSGWKPKQYTGSYLSNGFNLRFLDSSNVGDDSAQTNDFTWSGTASSLDTNGPSGAQSNVVIPYSIDKLEDVDISTTAPTDGQALVWDNANSKFKPGTVSGGGSSLPTANDGEALIYENGQWVAGPVVGGVNYTTSVVSARYWRLTNISIPNSFGIEAREIALFTSNAETLTAYDYGPHTYSVSDLITPTTNMTFNSGSAADISDNTGNIFSITNAELGATGAYLQWDLGSAQQVTHIATHLYDNSTRFIESADVEYSNDGTNWTSAGSFSGVTAAGINQWSTYGAFNTGSTTNIVATGERKTSSVTTSSLATNASADVTLPLTGKAGQFVSVTVDYPAWVVFYTDAAARTADASRAQTTDALPGSGVLLEVATSTAGETVVVTPSSGYFNNESTPVSELSIKVVNLDSVARAITVDAKVIPLEA